MEKLPAYGPTAMYRVGHHGRQRELRPTDFVSGVESRRQEIKRKGKNRFPTPEPEQAAADADTARAGPDAPVAAVTVCTGRCASAYPCAPAKRNLCAAAGPLRAVWRSGIRTCGPKLYTLSYVKYFTVDNVSMPRGFGKVQNTILAVLQQGVELKEAVPTWVLIGELAKNTGREVTAATFATVSRALRTLVARGLVRALPHRDL